jgi:hypothetical protein
MGSGGTMYLYGVNTVANPADGGLGYEPYMASEEDPAASLVTTAIFNKVEDAFWYLIKAVMRHDDLREMFSTFSHEEMEEYKVTFESREDINSCDPSSSHIEAVQWVVYGRLMREEKG